MADKIPIAQIIQPKTTKADEQGKSSIPEEDLPSLQVEAAKQNQIEKVAGRWVLLFLKESFGEMHASFG